MIEVDDIHKRFGARVAVRALSCRAADGAITGLLGANGAGKSTTLRIATGVMRPDTGAIRLDGVAVSPDACPVRGRIGALLDHAGLYPRLSPRQHLRYFGRLHGLRAAQLDARVDDALHVVGLETLADRPTAGFSQGERVRTALARALVHEPTHLLLDEPTSGLDVPTVRAVHALLRRLRDRGACIVLSSHVMQDVAALCDRVIIVARGTVVAEGTPAELGRRAGGGSLEDAFVALAGLEETC
jgi:sodium transport system ATP-binding protein